MPVDANGIKKLYPSSDTNTQEFILPMTVANQTNNSNFDNSVVIENGNLFSFSNAQGQIGWYEAENEEDSGDITMFISVPGVADSVEVDCEMNFEEAEQNGSTGMASAEWHNTETTVHVFLDQVQKSDNYLFVESRAGYKPNEDTGDICCAGGGYGAGIYAHSTSSFTGKVFLYKEEWFRSIENLVDKTQNVLPTFYQRWFGIKKVIYNKQVADKLEVHVELYISPSDQPADYANWVQIYNTTDYIGRNWTKGGQECNGVKDQPITWAQFFTIFGWNGIDLVRFKNLTVREIDPNGTFGEDPEPPPEEEPDPPDTDPEDPPIVCPIGQHEEGGICVPDSGPPIPPDTTPPATPTTITKRMTLRREIINSSLCSCDGIPPVITNPPDPGGGGGSGGGGGGSSTLTTIYNVAPTTSFIKLASVSNASDYFLRYGQIVSQTNSVFIGAKIARIEIRIAEFQDPRGGTGSGVHCRIRKGSDDSIAATLSPVADEDTILNAGILWVYENLENEYQMVFGDRILFEYDGGDQNNYIQLFRSGSAPNTGSKVTWQSNAQDEGEYSDSASFDMCMRIFKKEVVLVPIGPEDDP